jgi:hypothetical protein
MATKARTSAEGQRLSVATKRATEAGVNVPMVNMMRRIYGKAQRDPLKARVDWEDLQYYLLECTDFEQIAPAGMFSPAESGQHHEQANEQPPPEPAAEQESATLQ